MCAAEHGHKEIVKLLLAQPDIDASLSDCVWFLLFFQTTFFISFWLIGLLIMRFVRNFYKKSWEDFDTAFYTDNILCAKNDILTLL